MNQSSFAFVQPFEESKAAKLAAEAAQAAAAKAKADAEQAELEAYLAARMAAARERIAADRAARAAKAEEHKAQVEQRKQAREAAKAHRVIADFHRRQNREAWADLRAREKQTAEREKATRQLMRRAAYERKHPPGHAQCGINWYPAGSASHCKTCGQALIYTTDRNAPPQVCNPKKLMEYPPRITHTPEQEAEARRLWDNLKGNPL